MNKEKAVAAQYRQGDVLIERVSALPKDLKKAARENGRIVLAHGEVTGHAHAIADKHCEPYTTGNSAGVTHLDVRKAMAALQHEEHGTIELAPGRYQVIRQREYSPETIRRVAD